MAEKSKKKKRERKPKARNPFRLMVRNLVSLHTTRVGEGAIEASASIEREITLANGAKYALSIRRISPSTNAKIGAFDFPPAEKKEISS